MFDWMGAGVTALSNQIMQERQLDRDADAADTAWRRGQENMGISNAFAAAEADKARAFNERMAGSSHQREVADLRAAGLNPILSRNAGAPVTGPMASSSMSSAPTQAGAPDFSKGMSSALAAQRLKADLANIKEDTILKTQQQFATSAAAERDKQAAQLSIKQQSTQEHLTEAAEHNASILGNSAKGMKLEGEIDTTRYGELMRYIDRAMRAITGGSSAVQRLQPR